MTGLTYDSGALNAAERNERRMWLIHRKALKSGIRPVVPAAVLSEHMQALATGANRKLDVIRI